MKLPRRKFLHLAAGAGALPAVSRTAWAQTYPSRPVRILAGAPPGGGTDINDLGATVFPGSPADFGRFIVDETEKWGKVVKFSGAKVD